MEGTIRKPFQGVTNIVRFNWHFYVIALVLVAVLFLGSQVVNSDFETFIIGLAYLIIISTVISLVVSYYIYDFSNLYHLNWLTLIKTSDTMKLVNINAGFDETSKLLSLKYPASNLVVFDFYDPEKHTEISIERARRSYPIYPGTQKIETHFIPLVPNSVDYIFLILSAHEIRDTKERIIFFNGLRDCLKKDGTIIVVEHLRDIPNFLAYNFGFFHFHSKKEWQHTFNTSGLCIDKEIKITSFLSAFTLKHDGITS
jgi:hypothetical protein